MSRVVVIVSVTSAGPVVARQLGVARQGGDEIAALQSLTPEQARQFVAKRSDVTARLDTGKAALAFARGGVSLRGALMLTGLESLDAETAAVLADYRGPGLSILGLTTLSTEEARLLAGLGNRWNGRLPNVKNLTAEIAAVLAGFEGVNKVVRLELDGATLSAETARELAGFPRGLLLRGMTQAVLSDDMLAALAEYNGAGLGLGGLTALPPNLAKRVARTFTTKFLFLDDVTELSPEAAAALGGCPLTNLWLRGLTDLSPGAAKGLGWRAAEPEVALR